MKKKLTTNQRGLIAEKVMEWGNLVFISVVIVQIFPGPFNIWAVITGTLLIAIAYFFAIFYMKGGKI